MREAYGAEVLAAMRTPESSCQALKAAPVDAEVARLILKALEPAAIEASLAAALDLEAERKALNQHWSQRLERAQHRVDQARRRYASVEPENRLVARTLEQDWETALGEQARLLADHERFQRGAAASAQPVRIGRHPRSDPGSTGPLAGQDDDSARASNDRTALARTDHRHRDRRQRAGSPRVPLAGR